MEYYSTIKKNGILPSVTTWMDLEGAMLNERSQRKTNTVCFHLYVETKKQNKRSNITKQKQTHIYRKTSGCQSGGQGKG